MGGAAYTEGHVFSFTNVTASPSELNQVIELFLLHWVLKPGQDKAGTHSAQSGRDVACRPAVLLWMLQFVVAPCSLGLRAVCSFGDRLLVGIFGIQRAALGA